MHLNFGCVIKNSSTQPPLGHKDHPHAARETNAARRDGPRRAVDRRRPGHLRRHPSGSVGGAATGTVRENFDTLSLSGAGGTTASGITVSFTGDGKVVTGAAGGQYAAPYLSGGNGAGFGPGGTTGTGIKVTFTGGDGQVATGSLVNQYAAPYLSGGNGAGFGAGGSTQADGPDATRYLTTGIGMVTLLMPTLQTYFGILWGSIDGYNTLQFYNGAKLVESFTVGDIVGGPNGDQGVNGTLYVNFTFNGGDAYNNVVLLSSNYAFEVDNIAFNNPAPVSEPRALAVLGMGLLGLGLVRRRRAAGA